MDEHKNKKDKKEQAVSCALRGSAVCPKPDKCDGLDRQCTKWINHSGR